MSIGAGALVAYSGLKNSLRPAARLILFARSFVELQGAAFLLRDSVLAFRADDACAIRRNHEKPPAKVAYLLVAASSGIIRIHPVKAGRFGADQHHIKGVAAGNLPRMSSAL